MPVKKPKPKRAASALTAPQAAYVEARSSGATAKDSMIVAGMTPSDGTAHALDTIPKIKQALSSAHKRNQFMLGMTREMVLQGIMDAVDQAKIMADPVAQIMGWKEVAKICGFYAPEVKRLELGQTAQAYLTRMEQLDDKMLLAMSEAEIEDVDFTERSAENGDDQ